MTEEEMWARAAALTPGELRGILGYLIRRDPALMAEVFALWDRVASGQVPGIQARAAAEDVPVDEIPGRGPLFLSALIEGREYTGN